MRRQRAMDFDDITRPHNGADRSLSIRPTPVRRRRTVSAMNTEVRDLAARYVANCPQPEVARPVSDDLIASMAEVDDLLRTASKDDLIEFFATCCEEQPDEVLAYVAAGPLEDAVNRGHTEATAALIDAARKNPSVRRAIGYSWFGGTSESIPLADQIAELKRLAGPAHS